MKILVDENIPFAKESFGMHGELEFFSGRDLTSGDLKRADALIVRSVTKVGSELLKEYKPKFVGTCTIGTDHLETGFLESAGIVWAYAPGSNAMSVVCYVLSCLSALDVNKTHKTVGIVGCGNVGGLVRKELAELGFSSSVYDPFLSTKDCTDLASLAEVFSSSLVCLHTPLTKAGPYPTLGMIGQSQLEKLPENAVLISAGRGGVIREEELLSFMDSRPDVSVVLDVWANEPRLNSELLEKVHIATPHVAGYSLDGKHEGTKAIYQAFCRHFGLEENLFPQLPPNSVSKSGGNESVFDQALLCYDPRNDSENMRRAWENADQESREAGSWFDELRRNYPERREISGSS